LPLFDYECVNCGERQELAFKVAEFPESVKCPQCGEQAIKIIVHGHGSIQCDSIIGVPWLESAIDNLQPDHERRLETRGEYNKYLKDKGMIASG